MLNTHDATTLDEVAGVESDSVLADVDLPLQALYHPMGFPLEVASNSPFIMAAAEQSWGRFEAKFACPPLLLRIGVCGGSDEKSEPPPAPVCRMQWDLLSIVADPQNFIVSDLRAGRSFGWVTQNTAEAALYVRYHFLEAAALAMVAGLRAAPLHAACVTLAGAGVLLCGDSGAGKSSLAFACARAGWTYTSDDSAYIPLDRRDRLVVGNPRQIRFRTSGIHLFPELEGWPVTPRAAGKPSIEIPTAELSGFITAGSSTIEHIVFLNRRSAGSPRLAPSCSERVLPWFKRFLYSSGQCYAGQRDALRRVLEAEISELHYQDINWAVNRLEALVRTGR